MRESIHQEQGSISCFIFQQKEPIIREFADRLNKVKGYQHKVELTSDLLRCVDMLLACPEFNVDSLDCKNCRLISGLRKTTANIIIKAKKLT